MSKLQSLSSTLGNDSTISTIGYIVGMFYHIKLNRKFLEAPLTNISKGIIEGFLYSMGATFVASLLPNGARPIIPLSMLASLSYLKYKDVREELDGTNDDDNDEQSD